MWKYDKKLQYPIHIKNTNPALAKFIISQYGGPDGEIGASLRYLSQRYSMPFREVAGILTDVGTDVYKRQADGWEFVKVGQQAAGRPAADCHPIAAA